jgi:vacuolar-type H+-ATPase subunit E/Vma4
VLQNQKTIEETAKESIRQMQEASLSALESQKQQLAEFAQSVKEEVEEVTSNHGSKFLRNLAITLILATIAGGITSWCVGKYFPAFIQLHKASDIKVQLI